MEISLDEIVKKAIVEARKNAIDMAILEVKSATNNYLLPLIFSPNKTHFDTVTEVKEQIIESLNALKEKQC
jgi:hypothetical protein